MSKAPKIQSRIFVYSQDKNAKRAHTPSPQTPKRKPIFSQQKHSTQKKAQASTSPKKQQSQFKIQAADFLHKMLGRVQTKSILAKQIQQQNIKLKKQNEELRMQSNQILKRIAICSGMEKLKEKNTEYRAKLLKAEALLYQLKRLSKGNIRGIDQVITNLHF